MGGNILGYYGGLFSPDGNSILAHGYNGAFHLWSKELSNEQQNQEGIFYIPYPPNKTFQFIVWNPQITVSGHFGPVSDISWDPSYQYLVSVRYL
jgi:elongator complex protein 2